jgi:hypothetical protein
MSSGESYVRCSVYVGPRQTYALHREVFLDAEGLPFVMLHCHFHGHTKKASPWVVELKNEGEDDAPWSMHFLKDDEIQVNEISGIKSHFQQPLAHYAAMEGMETECPLRLCNEYDLGPTWTDFYQGQRKVARVYTHYYRHGRAVDGATLPDLLWLRAEEDHDTESDEYS